MLLVHGLTGAAALCLGARQFSSRLRQSSVAVHRALGRLYVISVAISAPLGIVVTILRNEIPLQYRRLGRADFHNRMAELVRAHRSACSEWPGIGMR